MEHLLELKDMHYYYGQIHAVKGINMFVNKGEIVALIGSNGAGKSTTLNTIAGLTKASPALRRCREWILRFVREKSTHLWEKTVQESLHLSKY